MKLHPTFRYALIASGIFIGIKLLTFITHTQFSGIGIYSGLISLILTAVPLYFGIRYKRDVELGGVISLKQAFLSGVTISILAALIAGIYTYLHYWLIDTEVVTHWVEEAKLLGAQAHKSDAEIKKAIVMLTEFYSPFKQMLGTLVGFLGSGSLISFILSTFLVKKQK